MTFEAHLKVKWDGDNKEVVYFSYISSGYVIIKTLIHQNLLFHQEKLRSQILVGELEILLGQTLVSPRRKSNQFSKCVPLLIPIAALLQNQALSFEDLLRSSCSGIKDFILKTYQIHLLFSNCSGINGFII